MAPRKRIEDFIARHDPIGRPARRAADVHVFDESNFRIHASSELDEVGELVIVNASDYDRIDF